MRLLSRLSNEEYTSVIDEMNRIFEDSKFGSSQRCVKLLRRLIENALAGEPEAIKERTLGVEVFGRDPDYDTNADPVVRMAATEIRKRLGLYYVDPDHLRDVTIRLNPGGYLPEFDFNTKRKEVPEEIAEPQNFDLQTSNPATPGDASLSSNAPEPGGPQTASFWAKRSRPLWGMVLLTVGIISYLTLPLLFHWNKPSPLRLVSNRATYSFWKPLLDSSEPTFLCISDLDSSESVSAKDSALPKAHSNDSAVSSFGNGAVRSFPRVDFVDANSAHKLTTALGNFGVHSILHLSSFLNFKNIAYQPVVFVGGMSNPWSTRMLANLRYSLRSDSPTGERWIHDAQNPSKRDWKSDGVAQEVEFDYAVVARFFDEKTRQWYFVFSGLYQFGTEAACDLMTDTKLIHLIPEDLSANKNVEIVLRTRVIGDSPGPPEILTVYTW